MAITFVAQATPTGGDTAAPSIGVPSGVQANDIVVVILWTPTVTTITPPSGFAYADGFPSSVGSNTTHVFWKRLTGADSGTYDFTSSANTWHSRGAYAFRGVVSSGDPWETDFGQAQASSSASANVNMDVIVPNSMGILLCGAWSGDEGTWTIPSGWTAPSGTFPGANFNFTYKLLTTAGNTGSVALTAPNAGNGVNEWIGALKPAMTAPTLAATYTAAIGVQGDMTIAVTVATDDILVVLGGTEDTGYTLGTPAGGGLTYTSLATVSAGGFTNAYGWWARATSGASFNITVDGSGSSVFQGVTVLRYSGASGIGAVASTTGTGAPSLAITTEGDKSAIAMHAGDWNAVSGASRTYRTANSTLPTERAYGTDPSRATMYVATYADAGVPGAETVGLTAPTGQKYSIIAVEVLGTPSSGGGLSRPVSLDSTATLTAAGQVAKTATATMSESASLTAAGSVGRSASATMSLTASLTSTGAIGAGLGSGAPLPIAVEFTTTHRKDTTGGATRSLTVAITAAGAVGKSSAASMSLAPAISSAGLATRASTADRLMTVTITATGQSTKAAPSTLGATVAITAAGYKGSGAASPTRWIRINGSWVKVPA